MFDGMFDVRIATSSNIIDKIRKLQSSYQSLLILMTKNQLEAQQEVGQKEEKKMVSSKQ